MSVIRNVCQPFAGVTSAPNPDEPNESTTRWITLGDLTNKVYYYISTMSPYTVWVDLKSLDFSEGTPIRKLELVKHPDRAGNCTDQFVTSAPFSVLPPDIH